MPVVSIKSHNVHPHSGVGRGRYCVRIWRPCRAITLHLSAGLGDPYFMDYKSSVNRMRLTSIKMSSFILRYTLNEVLKQKHFTEYSLLQKLTRRCNSLINTQQTNSKSFTQCRQLLSHLLSAHLTIPYQLQRFTNIDWQSKCSLFPLHIKIKRGLFR